MKKVLWIIWTLASGKDALAEMISEHFLLPSYQISAPLKMIAKERWVWPERSYLVTLGRELAEKYGDDYLARYLVENATEEIFLIVGMRQLGQIDYLRKNTDFTLIGIDADPEIRFNRLVSRAKPWDPFSWEEFQKIESMDNSTNDAQKIWECLKYADYIYMNNGSFEEFKSQVDIIGRIAKL